VLNVLKLLTRIQGRPLRVRKTDYIVNWEANRQDEIKDLTGKGVLPVQHDADAHPDDEQVMDNLHPQLMGIVAGLIDRKSSAREIVDDMVEDAARRLRDGALALTDRPRL
jgi:NAD(P)H-dependent flavin oxidoreductase YrpB (nitropropane dioxygenase family)